MCKNYRHRLKTVSVTANVLSEAANIVINVYQITNTVVHVMNGHPRDKAKVSVHDRWPLVRGTEGRAGGGAKRNIGVTN